MHAARAAAAHRSAHKASQDHDGFSVNGTGVAERISVPLDPFSNIGASLACSLTSSGEPASPKYSVKEHKEQGRRTSLTDNLGKQGARRPSLLDGVDSQSLAKYGQKEPHFHTKSATIDNIVVPSVGIPRVCTPGPPCTMKATDSQKSSNAPTPRTTDNEGAEDMSEDSGEDALEVVHPGSRRGSRSSHAPGSRRGSARSNGLNVARDSTNSRMQKRWSGVKVDRRATDEKDHHEKTFPLRRLMNLLKDILLQGKVDVALNLLNYIFDQASVASLLDMPITENLMDFTNRMVGFMNAEFSACSAFFQEIEANLISTDGGKHHFTSKLSATRPHVRSHGGGKRHSHLIQHLSNMDDAEKRRVSLVDVLGVDHSRAGSRRTSSSRNRDRASERSERHLNPHSQAASERSSRGQGVLQIPSPITSRRESSVDADEEEETSTSAMQPSFSHTMSEPSPQGWSVQPSELHIALLRTGRADGAGAQSACTTVASSQCTTRRETAEHDHASVACMLDGTPPAPPGQYVVPPMPVGHAPSLPSDPSDNALSVDPNTQSELVSMDQNVVTPSPWLNLGQADSDLGATQAWDQANPNAVSRFSDGAQPGSSPAAVEDSASDESMVEDSPPVSRNVVDDVLADASQELTADDNPEANLVCDMSDAHVLISQSTEMVEMGPGASPAPATPTGTHSPPAMKPSSSQRSDASDGGLVKKKTSTASAESGNTVTSSCSKSDKVMPKRNTGIEGTVQEVSKVTRGHLPAVGLTAIIGVLPGDKDREGPRATLNLRRGMSDQAVGESKKNLKRSMTQPLETRMSTELEAEEEISRPSLRKCQTQQVLKETRFLVPTRNSTGSAYSDDSEVTDSSSDNSGQVVKPGASDSSQKEIRYVHAREDEEDDLLHPSPTFGRRVSKFVEKRTETIKGIFKEQLDEDKAVFLGTASHKYVIHPSGSFRMAWDIGALVIILMESVILPLGLCFDIYPHEAVLWVSTGFFLPDIVLNFLTGFYHNGLLIMRQRAIAKHYCLGWFLIDFMSTIPWEVALRPLGGDNATEASFMLKLAKVGKLMRVLRLLRVLKLKSLLERVEDMFSSYIILFTLSITKTVAVYCLFCHWTACVWGWLGDYDMGIDEIPYNRTKCEPDGPCENGIGINDSPWRRRYGLTDTGNGQQYLTALQFAAGLLTGAELPLSPGWWCERLFLTVMMIVSFLVCSMIISQIVVVMEKINQDNAEYLEQTRTIRDFMVSRGMPMRLQTKVRRYLEYQFKSRKVVHQNHEVMMKLSPFLRIEIQEHMNRTVLENHPFFAGMDKNLLSHVCSIPHSMLYAPGDIVCRKGQLCSSLCFILRGQLQIVDAREGFFIYIRAPAWTCDRGLFVTYAITHTINCSMHSELLTIRQQDLINLVNDFPSSQHYIKEYCQKVVDNDPAVSFCDYCRRPGHGLDNCEELDMLCLGGSPEREKRSSVQSNVTLSEQIAKVAQKGWRKVLQKSKTSVQLLARNMNKHTDLDERIGVDELTEGTRGIEAKRVDRASQAARQEQELAKSKADALSAWGDY